MDQQKTPVLILRFARTYFSNQTNADICILNTAAVFLGMMLEIALVIVVSNIFHMFLKRLGQPSVVSQMLAGFLFGPIALGSRKCNIFHEDNAQIKIICNYAPISFVFLVGLEININYIKHKIRTAAIICGWNAITCLILSIIVGPVLKLVPFNRATVAFFTPTLFLILVNTSSPVLIRIINKLKLTTTEIGRVSVSFAIVNDALCIAMLAMLGLVSFFTIGINRIMVRVLQRGWAPLALLMAGIFLIRTIVIYANKKNDYRKEVGDDLLCALLMIVFGVSQFFTAAGIDAMIAAFVMGLVIPRNGPTSRTMVKRMTCLVNYFILPVYFADAGMKTDFKILGDKQVLITIGTVILMGTIGKVGGTMVAAKFLGMQLREGLVLALLLNVKGHIDLMIITFGTEKLLWDERAHMALLITVLFNSIIAGPIALYVIRRERQAIQYTYKGLEWLNLHSELRILACVHSSQDVPTMLDLIEISSGYCEPDQHSKLVPYIFNLIELTKNITSHTMLYHQLQEKQDFNNDTGNSQVRQISGMVDKFVIDSNINVYELTAISRIGTMHEDLQHAIQDVHAALVVLPFHRRRRFDGKMGIGKEDIRQFNINVLRYAPCSVGILVDRGMDKEVNQINGGPALSISSDGRTLLRVVVLFVGGPDDREAAAYAGRLALHPCVTVTMVRFFHTSKQGGGSGVNAHESHASSDSCRRNMHDDDDDDDDDDDGGSTGHDQDEDESFVLDFFNKFVVSNIATYEERRVATCTELVRELSSMQGLYSLYILGRQSQGPTMQLMEGMSSKGECPELGPIGDLLTSSDFMSSGSILVIKQHSVTAAKVS